jgi:transmembrane sensor
MMPNQQEITLLLEKLSMGTISREDLDRLYQIIHQDGEDMKMTSSLMLKHLHETGLTEEDLIYWKERLAHMPGAITGTKRLTPLYKMTWFKYAAAILLMLTGTGIYYALQKPASTTEVVQTSTETEILPGSEKAILTLSDGSRVELDEAGPMINDGNLSIQNKDGHLSYKDEGIVAMNTMSTPKGGQYQLTLADGTRIWLNAQSSITFPTAFPGKTREVKITGEVYFEVAHNRKKPFSVSFNDQQLVVLGTSFNINDYPEEPGSTTTLINGSIKLAASARSVILTPGEQAVVSNGLKINSAVNIDQVLAWKNGTFNFNGQDFAASMRQLERWYNIKVVYDYGIPSEKLGGEIERNMTLNQALKVLDGIVARFRLDGNTLHVLPL